MNSHLLRSRTLASLAFLLGGIVSLSSAPASEPVARLVMGLKSADQFISDMEYMVVKLSDKQETWDNALFPNIDIFLIGVDKQQPVRFDLLFDQEQGRYVQGIIPIERLRDFLNDNLDPIDIRPDRVRTDATLYELTGGVYEGWLRHLKEPGEYAVFFPKSVYPNAGDVPKELPNLQKQQAAVINDGLMAFVHLLNDSKDVKTRQTAIKNVTGELLGKLEKQPQESKDAYALREALLRQQLELIEEWFSEAQEIKTGLKIDQQTGRGLSSLRFAAIPGTQLEKVINRVSEKPSHFLAVKAPEDALLKLRVNFPYSSGQQAGLGNIYELMRSVIKEKIQEDKNPSAEEKKVREEMADLLMDVFVKSSAMGYVDLMADIFPTGNAHTLLIGVRCTGKEKIEQVISQLPEAKKGWTIDKKVAEVGGVAIHKLSLNQQVPKSLLDFYGPAGIHLAVSDNAFWFCGGEDSLNILQDRLKSVQSATATESDNVMLSLDMHVRPILENLYQFSQEDNLQIIDPAKEGGLLRPAEQQKKEDEPPQGEEVPGSRARQALQGFQWEQTAIDAMEGLDDRLSILIKRTESGVVDGPGSVEKGILKAVGMVIAKFADENLK